jgi:hypothetical protein
LGNIAFQVFTHFRPRFIRRSCGGLIWVNSSYPYSIKKIADHVGYFAALYIPFFDGNEKRYLAECVDSNVVSSIGEFVDRFEGMLAAFTGVKQAVLCVNGTAALYISLPISGNTSFG